MAQWVTYSPRSREDVGSNPATGRYIVARMTNKSCSPLSLCPISNASRMLINGHSFSFCLSVRLMLVTRELDLYLCRWEESKNALSPVVQRDITMSLNIYNISDIK